MPRSRISGFGDSKSSARARTAWSAMTLELDTGEFGCLLMELGESGAEVLVLEPTVQGAAVHLGEASGFRYGGGCAE